MKDITNFILDTAQSSLTLFIIVSMSFGVKLFFLTKIIPQGSKKRTIKQSWIFIIGIIVGALFGDIAWLLKLGRVLFVPTSSYKAVTFLIRIAWAFLLIQYQSLSLFVHSLTNKKFRLSLFHQLCLIGSGIISSYFTYLAFFQFDYLSTEATRDSAKEIGGFLEFQVMQSTVFYLLCILTIPALYNIIQKLRTEQIPKILAKQLKLFIVFLMIPYFCAEFILGFSFKIIDSDQLRPLIAFSTILLAVSLYYFLRKIMELRFLNATDHVQAKPKINVLDEFKTVLEQLSSSSSLQELGRISQTFFKEAFGVPHRSVTLIIREWQQHDAPYDTVMQSSLEHYIESFLNSSPNTIQEYLNTKKILLYDELSFDNYYNESSVSNKVITFLKSINSDIFLPIFMKQKIVAFLVVSQDARSICYTQAERDAMLVFSNYLGNVINILQHKNFETLVHKEKELKEELYYRHQEINQYKESINTFLRKNKQKPIGILFYKNKQFSFGNHAAKELIKININTQEGHPLSKALKHVARQVESFKTPYTHCARDEHGQKIILSGVPHLQQNNVIITIVYPEISDIIAPQMNQLNNPNDWDYVLYLESTNAGQQINLLIPGSGQTLLNFKIKLLKAALSKRTLLLDMPDEDVLPAVEQLHHISLRETLHTIELQYPTKADVIAPKLFGINPIFAKNSTSLLQALHLTGTLFIKNVHFLDMEIQNYLADYILYGFYQVYKSEQKINSAVRIICSTNQNISQLVQEGTFSLKLFNALKPTIAMPSLSAIEIDGLYSLIDGFTDQALKTHTFKNMLALTEKEKDKIIQTLPTSLHELKMKVQQILMKKSKDHNMQPETLFDPAYEVSDPELIHAARMGKKALKDQKTLALLWHKFKSQNKIALFLGVNRSSVNRRFKEYNIGLSGEETVA